MLPSCVGISPSGELLVGESARNQQLVYPERTVRSIKRKMGSSETVSLGDKKFTPQEISALILRELAEWARRELEQPVNARRDHGARVFLRRAAQRHARSGHAGGAGSGAHPQRAHRRQPGLRLRRRRAAHRDGLRSGRRHLRRLHRHRWKAMSPRCWPATATIAWAATISTICCWSSWQAEFQERHGIRIGARASVGAGAAVVGGGRCQEAAQLRALRADPRGGAGHAERQAAAPGTGTAARGIREDDSAAGGIHAGQRVEGAGGRGQEGERAGRDPAGGRVHAYAAGVAPAARAYRTGAARGRASRSVRGVGRRSAGVASGGPRSGARAGGCLAVLVRPLVPGGARRSFVSVLLPPHHPAQHAAAGDADGELLHDVSGTARGGDPDLSGRQRRRAAERPGGRFSRGGLVHGRRAERGACAA